MNFGGRSSGTPEGGTAKVESRLSILALLAPSSPESPQRYNYAAYQGHQAALTPSPPLAQTEYTLPTHQQLQDTSGQANSSSKPSKFQALLPRPSDQLPPPPPPAPALPARHSGSSVPRRIATIVACENCRAKRTKCDGARPKCSRCVRLGTGCEYDAGPDESRSVARKRKYEEMRHDLGEIQELVDYLRVKPLSDVAEIIRRIRIGEDPSRVLRLVRDGDLLLQASALYRQGIEFDKEEAIQKLDTTALQNSPIRVSAKPWTDVAGDGLVSELVSLFFDTEQPFSTAYVDRFCFLRDMRSSGPKKARFCSPALVNSICALVAFTSETAKAIDLTRGGNIREDFYAEAKKQLDLEHGKDSVTTAMVLYTLFLYASAAGIDRAGGPHRLTAGTMYRRLRMGTNFPAWVGTLEPAERVRARKALSRAAWGLFCLESISSFVYIQPALIRPPTLPQIFDGSRDDNPPENLDCPDLYLEAECGVSILLFDIMCYNRQSRLALGTPEDITARLSHYQRLMGWVSPPRGAKGRGLSGLAQSIFLQAYFSIAAIALFRPLTTVDTVLPNGLGSPSSFCVQHCKRMVERVQEFEHMYPEEAAKGCVGTLYFFYVCSTTLVALLDKDPDSHRPFIQACRHFHHVSKSYGVGPALLKGLQAMSLEMSVRLPKQSWVYFAEAGLQNKNLKDVPVSYIIPQLLPASAAGGDCESDPESGRLELGELIEKWSSVSIQQAQDRLDTFP